MYQEVDGRLVPVEGRFARLDEPCLRERCPSARFVVGVQVAAYDVSRPLVIDPVLSYATYLGGSGAGDDIAWGIAVDAGGNAYVTGETASLDFPTANALQPAHRGGSQEAFVVKLNPTGSALVYATYLGGSGSDAGLGIAVDTEGNAYVTGNTDSSDFPTANALQPARRGSNDIFVARISEPPPGGRFDTVIACPATASPGPVSVTVTFRNRTQVARNVARAALIVHAGKLSVLGPRVVSLATQVPAATLGDPPCAGCAPAVTPAVVTRDLSILLPAQARPRSFVSLGLVFFGQVGTDPKRRLLGSDACTIEIAG